MKTLMRRIGLAVAVLGVAAVAAKDAKAGLVLGSSARGTLSAVGYSNSNIFDNSTATLQDPGIEFADTSTFYRTVTADFTASTLTLAAWMPANTSVGGFSTSTVQRYEFSGLQATDGETITGLSLASATGFTVADFSFTGDSIKIDIARYSMNRGDAFSAVFDITTTPALAAVPEPSTLAGGLLGVTLMGVAWLRRQRQAA